MNLILLKADELDAEGTVCIEGRRARHVMAVLRGRKGQTMRVGVLDGPKGTGTIEEIGKDRVVIRCRLDAGAPPVSRVDVLLALPRPKVMKRLWAPLASMGVGTLCLTNAEKVERDYFDTHWLEPENYKPLLMEGLEQAGDTRIPRVRIVKRLKPFLEDELDATFPLAKRLLTHPGDGLPLGRLQLKTGERVLVAIGPEGGWTDFELKMFERVGFTRVSMGARTLRIDTACVALLALVNAMMEG